MWSVCGDVCPSDLPLLGWLGLSCPLLAPAPGLTPGLPQWVKRRACVRNAPHQPLGRPAVQTRKLRLREGLPSHVLGAHQCDRPLTHGAGPGESQRPSGGSACCFSAWGLRAPHPRPGSVHRTTQNPPADVPEGVPPSTRQGQPRLHSCGAHAPCASPCVPASASCPHTANTPAHVLAAGQSRCAHARARAEDRL